jgi:phosphoserine phosphatase
MNARAGRDRILRAVAGHPASDIEALGDHFMTDLVESVTPAMAAVLAEHAAQSRDRIVLSASPTEIVSRFAREAGLEMGTGTTSERDANGRYTGRLEGPFCYREGKVAVMAHSPLITVTTSPPHAYPTHSAIDPAGGRRTPVAVN